MMRAKKYRETVSVCGKEEKEGASTSTVLLSAQLRANLAGLDN